MKKSLVSLAAVLFILTGCDASKTDTLSCEYERNLNNIKTRIVNNIDYEDDDVKKVRITYSYNSIDDNNEIDGVGTGTDGTTNDTQIDNDGIVDGVVGKTFDSIISGTTDIILDIAGLKDRHMSIQNEYNDINGFSVENVLDNDKSYTATYVIDFDNISLDDINRLNLSKNINDLKSNYISQGYTCK